MTRCDACGEFTAARPCDNCGYYAPTNIEAFAVFCNRILMGHYPCLRVTLVHLSGGVPIYIVQQALPPKMMEILNS